MADNRPTVLVTGGAGYIGSHTVLALLDAGFRVVAIDDLPRDRRCRLDARATFIEGSSSNASLLRMMLEFHRVAVVVHCAGLHSIDEAQCDPSAPYRSNVAALLTLLEGAIAVGASKVVMLSSTAVYGPEAGAAPDETSRLRPATVLGRSHGMGEQMLGDFARIHGMSACVLRSGLVAGADPLGRTGPVRGAAFNPVFQALEVAFGMQAETVIRTCGGSTRDGSVIGGYVHVSDLADALVAATVSILDGPPRVTTYNCGYDTGCSDRMVVEAVGRITAMRIRHRMVPAGSDCPAEQNPNAQAIRAALGWNPVRAGLDVLVRDTLWWGMRSSQGEEGVVPAMRPSLVPELAGPSAGP